MAILASWSGMRKYLEKEMLADTLRRSFLMKSR
jgi:hypothetical protein